MDCQFIRENLFAHREKLLPESTAKEYEEHLQSCDSCAAVVSGFESVISAIGQKKAVEPDPFVSTRTIGRIEALLEPKNIRRQPVYKRALQPVLLSTLIILAVAIGFTLGRHITVNSPGETGREQDIRTLQADLFITDLMDEEKTFIVNQ